MPIPASHPLNPGEGMPIFISAGVFKYPAELRPFYEIEDPLMAPILTLGSYTYPEWPGNAAPGQTDFVYDPDRREAGNARGLPGPGVEGIRALKQPVARLSKVGVKTIISVTNLPHERPIDVIPDLVEEAAEVGATGIEINLSCPNGKKPDGSFHAPLCNDADASGEVIEASRERVGGEVLLGEKDGPHTASHDQSIDRPAIGRLAVATVPLVDFITGINTIPNQPFPELTCANGRGGQSGPIVAARAREHLAAWKTYAPELAYLSCGGVDTMNAGQEISERLAMDALLVGGAQEFYRARDPLEVTAGWFRNYVMASPE